MILFTKTLHKKFLNHPKPRRNLPNPPIQTNAKAMKSKQIAPVLLQLHLTFFSLLTLFFLRFLFHCSDTRCEFNYWIIGWGLDDPVRWVEILLGIMTKKQEVINEKFFFASSRSLSEAFCFLNNSVKLISPIH